MRRGSLVERESGDVRAPRASERGDTLVEVLVAIVILGVGAVALLAGFASAINGSSIHKTLTDSSNIVKSVSNEITAAMQSSTTAFTCPAVAVPTVTVPSGYSVSSSSIQYWTQDAQTQQWSWSSTCTAGTPELVTVTLSNSSNGSSNTSSFVVVDPTAPTSPSAGAASKVVFLVQPGGAVAGSPFLTQPVVAVEDSNGNIVTNDLSPLKLSSPDGTLSGCYGQETSGVVTYFGSSTQGCQFSAAGTFTLTASDGALQSASVSVVVAKKPNTITPTSSAPTQEIASQAGTYTPSATATSGDAVSLSTSSSLICSITNGVVSFTSVGVCVVDFNDPGNALYAAAPQVTQEIPVVNYNAITLSSATQQFASAQVNGPPFTPVATALSGDSVVVTSLTPQFCTVSGGVVSFVGATPSGQFCSLNYYDAALATNPNSTYASATLPQQLSVAKGANTITVSSAAPSNALYGGSYTPTVTATSGDTVSVASSPSSVCQWNASSGQVAFTGVGQCTLTYTDSGNANYVAASTQTQVFTVSPAPLTVTVQPATSTYGSTPSSFHVAYSGFVNGDSASVVTGSPQFTTSVTATTDVGTYPLSATVGTLSATNYTFSTFVASTITVQPAPLTVSASSPVSTYGSTPVTPTFTVTGEVNGDTPAQAYNAGVGQPTLSTTVTSSSGVGIYPVTVGAGTLVASSNYTLVLMNGSYTVQPAVLTVSAQNASMVYGSALPAFTYQVSGFVNGDTSSVLSGAPQFTTTGSSSASVGTYAITPTVGTLSAANYTFQFVAGTLTITPHPLVVSATGASTYGASPAPATVTYSGFVNGDTAAVLSGSPSVTSSVTSSSPSGIYPITVWLETLSAQNYTLSTQSGSYSVSPAPLYITASNQTITFGQAIPTLTYAVTGEVNGDSPSQAYSGAPSLSTNALTRSNAGQYTISVAPGTLITSSNYTPVFVSGTLTIQKALLTVTANSVTSTYGASLPTLTYSLSGFVSPDTASVVTGTPVLQTTATSTSSVGSYVVTVDTSTMSATNYFFVGANGLVTINQDTSSTIVTSTMPDGILVGHEDVAMFRVTVTTGNGESPATNDQATVTVSANGNSATCTTSSTGGWLHVGTSASYTEICSVAASALPLASGTATVSLSASFPGDSNIGASNGTGTSFTLYATNPDSLSLSFTPPSRRSTTGTFSGSAPAHNQSQTITLYYCTTTSTTSCHAFTTLAQPAGTSWSLNYTFSNQTPPMSGTKYYFWATEPDYYLGFVASPTINVPLPMLGPVTA